MVTERSCSPVHSRTPHPLSFPHPRPAAQLSFSPPHAIPPAHPRARPLRAPFPPRAQPSQPLLGSAQRSPNAPTTPPNTPSVAGLLNALTKLKKAVAASMELDATAAVVAEECLNDANPQTEGLVPGAAAKLEVAVTAATAANKAMRKASESEWPVVIAALRCGAQPTRATLTVALAATGGKAQKPDSPAQKALTSLFARACPEALSAHFRAAVTEAQALFRRWSERRRRAASVLSRVARRRVARRVAAATVIEALQRGSRGRAAAAQARSRVESEFAAMLERVVSGRRASNGGSGRGTITFEQMEATRSAATNGWGSGLTPQQRTQELVKKTPEQREQMWQTMLATMTMEECKQMTQAMATMPNERCEKMKELMLVGIAQEQLQQFAGQVKNMQHTTVMVVAMVAQSFPVPSNGGNGGCGPDCVLSHGGHGKCLVCGCVWGPHVGHTCGNGTRGSWMVDGGLAGPVMASAAAPSKKTLSTLFNRLHPESLRRSTATQTVQRVAFAWGQRRAVAATSVQALARSFASRDMRRKCAVLPLVRLTISFLLCVLYVPLLYLGTRLYVPSGEGSTASISHI